MNKNQCIIKMAGAGERGCGPRRGWKLFLFSANPIYLLFQTLTLDSCLSNKIVVLEIILP